MAAGDQVTIGEQGMIEQPERFTQEAGEVARITRRWEGPQTALDTKLLEVAGLEPDSTNYDRGTPSFVEAFWNFDVLPEGVITWELLSQKLPKPLSSHSIWQYYGEAAKTLGIIDFDVRRGTAASIDYSADYGFAPLNKYRDYRLLGIDTYQEWAYVLRKTTRISNASDVTINNTVPPSTVVTWLETGVPQDNKLVQPSIRRVQYPAQETPVWESVLVDQWLTEAPSKTYQRGKKIWTIAEEWAGAIEWADFYEGGTFSPSR